MNTELILNWGICSAGLISQDFCTAVLSLKSDYHKLAAIGARRLHDAKQVAQRFDIPFHFDSYEQLFNCQEVNIVYVGSVISTHKELCIKALNAGKHVLCEKSMAMNSREQEEIFEAAKRNGLFFMEAIWTRFFPIIDKIKQDLTARTIGDLNFFSGNFFAPIKNVERVRLKELGGGGILDIGIYPIQMACLVFNHETPTQIQCVGHLMETGVDECCTITLLYTGKRMAQINMSTNGILFYPTYLMGDQGVIQVDLFYDKIVDKLIKEFCE